MSGPDSAASPAASTQIPPQAASSVPESPTEIERHQRHNFLWLVLQQVVLRVGWVFKTESVIMPAFMDAVSPGGGNWLRSLLPMLNRFGQSIPPLLLAARLRAMPRKKLSLATTSGLMGVAFLTMSALCRWLGAPPPWLPAAFLSLYTVFFAATGLNNVALSTLHGKLIVVHLRGRLMAVAAALGSVFSVTACLLLMFPWLGRPDGGFHLLFLFAGILFIISAVCALNVREPADDYAPATNRGALPPDKADPSLRQLGLGRLIAREAARRVYDGWSVYRHDPHFRRLTAVAMLFSAALLLFPHYQALARERLDLSGRHLMVWVIVQNAAIGAVSLLIGPLADARGNRITLRVIILTTSAAPLLAIVLACRWTDAGGTVHHLVPVDWAQRLYWLVFAPLGMTPVTIRTMNNYALELCAGHDHPRYLATLSLCLSIPFLASPLVGLLLSATSFEVIFMGGFIMLLICGGLTWRLYEPRHHLPPAVSDSVTPDD